MTILFFHFDGTCNDPADAERYHEQDVSITNVLKSHLLLGGRLSSDTRASRLPSGNVSFYYAGVGTYGARWSRYLNAGFAIEQGDVGHILTNALIDFQGHYHSKVSTIILIGFSRGAALARRFAALIEQWLDRPIVIEAVMDTVASIGLPNLDISIRPNHDVVFEYGCTLPNCVVKALHLVALDEQRLAFRPTLINRDSRVEEVWLPGVHSDVGGGYRRDGLADVSLMITITWLHRLLKQSLYQSADTIRLVSPTITRDMLTIKRNPLGEIHYQHRSPWYSHLTLAPRHCHVLKNGDPCLKSAPLWHESVRQRQIQKPNYQPLARRRTDVKIWRVNENILSKM